MFAEAVAPKSVGAREPEGKKARWYFFEHLTRYVCSALGTAPAFSTWLNA
jgi:hypothetical protein